MQINLVQIRQLHIVAILICQHLVVVSRYRQLMPLKLQGGQREDVFQMALYDKGTPKASR